MLKQIVKSFMILALLVGALVSTEVSANGQLSSNLATADIPFDFIVADRTIPAGKYTVRKVTDNGKGVSIVGVDGRSIVTRLSNSAADKSNRRNARLVFHRYGQQHFLAEVWSGDTYGRQLLECKQERRLRQEQALIASKRDSGFEIVEIVAMVR